MKFNKFQKEANFRHQLIIPHPKTEKKQNLINQRVNNIDKILVEVLTDEGRAQLKKAVEELIT